MNSNFGLLLFCALCFLLAALATYIDMRYNLSDDDTDTTDDRTQALEQPKKAA